MILVTLGTHGQPMNRLVKPLEKLADQHPALGPFHAQLSGTNAPRGWTVETVVGPAELWRLIADADVVITHGGPSTIADVRAARKVPIVVPRRREFGEHVDDHQTAFARRLSGAGEIILVEDATDLVEAVRCYGASVEALPAPVPHDPRAAVDTIAAIADRLLLPAVQRDG